MPQSPCNSSQPGGGEHGTELFPFLLAVELQGLLIIVCVSIYAVLIQEIATGGDMIGAVWGCVGYTVLLCFTLFKTGASQKPSSARDDEQGLRAKLA